MEERDYCFWGLSLLDTLESATRMRREAAHSHNTQAEVSQYGRCLTRFLHFWTITVNGYPKMKPGTHHTLCPNFSIVTVREPAVMRPSMRWRNGSTRVTGCGTIAGTDLAMPLSEIYGPAQSRSGTGK